MADTKITELTEKRGKLAAEIKRQADDFNANEKRWKDDAARVAFEKVNSDYDANQKELDSALTEAEEARKTAEAVESRLKLLSDHESRSTHRGPIPGLDDTQGQRKIGEEDGKPITEEMRGWAFAGWLRGPNATDEQRAAMQRVGLRPGQEITLRTAPTHVTNEMQHAYRSMHHSRAAGLAAESRALSAFTAASGGVTIGETLIRNLEVNMLAFGGMRQVAQTLTTATGERMAWPTADDTSNTGEQLGESASIGSSTDPTFGAVYWDAYKFSSKPILVPYELLQDSFVNLPAVLGDMLGERLGRITNTRFTTGTGAGTAKGIVTASSLGVTTASGTAITGDELLGLVHSIDPAYRAGGMFMMHDSVMLYLRKLKDGEGRYLWQSGLMAGVPDQLLSYQIAINQDMQSSVATATKTILFGRLSAYKIRRVQGIRLYRLEERYRDNDQDGFIAFVREDGNLLTAGTAPVKHMLQA